MQETILLNPDEKDLSLDTLKRSRTNFVRLTKLSIRGLELREELVFLGG